MIRLEDLQPIETMNPRSTKTKVEYALKFVRKTEGVKNPYSRFTFSKSGWEEFDMESKGFNVFPIEQTDGILVMQHVADVNARLWNTSKGEKKSKTVRALAFELEAAKANLIPAEEDCEVKLKLTKLEGYEDFYKLEVVESSSKESTSITEVDEEAIPTFE